MGLTDDLQLHSRLLVSFVPQVTVSAGDDIVECVMLPGMRLLYSTVLSASLSGPEGRRLSQAGSRQGCQGGLLYRAPLRTQHSRCPPWSFSIQDSLCT